MSAAMRALDALGALCAPDAGSPAPEVNVDEVTIKLYRALKVLTTDDNIVAWLKHDEPQALQQAHQAVLTAESTIFLEGVPEPRFGVTVAIAVLTELVGQIDKSLNEGGLVQAEASELKWLGNVLEDALETLKD